MQGRSCDCRSGTEKSKKSAQALVIFLVFISILSLLHFAGPVSATANPTIASFIAKPKLSPAQTSTSSPYATTGTNAPDCNSDPFTYSGSGCVTLAWSTSNANVCSLTVSPVISSVTLPNSCNSNGFDISLPSASSSSPKEYSFTLTASGSSGFPAVQTLNVYALPVAIFNPGSNGITVSNYHSSQPSSCGGGLTLLACWQSGGDSSPPSGSDTSGTLSAWSFGYGLSSWAIDVDSAVAAYPASDTNGVPSGYDFGYYSLVNTYTYVVSDCAVLIEGGVGSGFAVYAANSAGGYQTSNLEWTCAEASLIAGTGLGDAVSAVMSNVIIGEMTGSTAEQYIESFGATAVTTMCGGGAVFCDLALNQKSEAFLFSATSAQESQSSTFSLQASLSEAITTVVLGSAGFLGGSIVQMGISGVATPPVAGPLASTSTTSTCGQLQISVGSSTSCSATVTGANANGAVTFSASGRGSVSFGSPVCYLASGSCSVTISGASPGLVSISATYDGDSNNARSTSGIGNVVVLSNVFGISMQTAFVVVKQGGSATNQLTVTSTSGYSHTITLSSSSPPSGATLGFTPQSGIATFTSTLSLTASISTVTGSYPITLTGTSDDGSIQTVKFSLIIGTGHPTSSSISPNPWTSSTGNKVVYTVTVIDTSNSPIVPTGTITWNDNGAGGTFPTGPICTLGRGSSSAAVCSLSYTSSSSSGVVTITSSYSGDGTHLPDSAQTSLNLVGTSGSSLCNAHITSSITLTGDVQCTSGNGPVLQGNGITLDCAGHSITNQFGGGNGVFVNFGSGDTVKNCRISGFQNGVYDGGDSDTVTGNTIENSLSFGIYITNTQSAASEIVSNNLVIGTTQQYGFQINGLGTITNNVAVGNVGGGFLTGPSGSTFTGNSAIDNGGDGFHLSVSSGAVHLDTFNGNIANGNSGNGFFLDGSFQNSFTNNTANGNGANGFDANCNQFACGSSNSFSSNTANSNSRYGFLDGTSGTGTSNTADSYTTDNCNGNSLAGSSPTLLCAGPPVIVAPPTGSVGQTLNITTSSPFDGGAPPYTCQWFEEPPGATTYTPIGIGFSCNPTSAPSLVTGPLSPAGAWSFRLQVTDGPGTSQATPSAPTLIFQSAPINVTIALAPTNTTVTCSARAVNVTGQATCTAMVTGISPSGQIFWSVGTPSVSLSSNSCVLSAGHCAVNVTGTAAGQAPLTLSYSGDNSNLGSSSSTAILVNKAVTASSLSCTGPVSVGFTSACTVIVSGASGSTTGEQVYLYASGTGNFDSSTCPLVSQGCGVHYTPVNSRGSSQVITAVYAGDGNNQPSLGTFTLPINQPLISLSQLSVDIGAAVSVSGTNLLPSHSLYLTYDGSNSGMPFCTIDVSGSIVSGCTFTVRNPTLGSHTVTGSDGTNQASVSITVWDFGISSSPTSLTVLSGSNTTSSIGLTSLFGYSGNITLAASISNVTLSVPTGNGRMLALAAMPCDPAVNLTNSTLFLSQNNSVQTILTISVPACVLPGTYIVTVNAQDFFVLHGVQLTLTVGSLQGAQPTHSANPSVTSEVSNISKSFNLQFGVSAQGWLGFLFGFFSLVVIGLAKGNRVSNTSGKSRGPALAKAESTIDPLLIILMRR